MPETVAITKIFELVLCGVMLTLRPVTSVKVVEVITNVSVFVVLITCKIRKAPRKLFIVADASVLDVKAAGSEVGVAMLFPLYENVGSV